MNWKDYRKKYAFLTQEFNGMPFIERLKMSRHNDHFGVTELMRAKKIVWEEGVNGLDKRIKQLEEAIEEKNQEYEAILKYKHTRNV